MPDLWHRHLADARFFELLSGGDQARDRVLREAGIPPGDSDYRRVCAGDDAHVLFDIPCDVNPDLTAEPEVPAAVKSRRKP